MNIAQIIHVTVGNGFPFLVLFTKVSASLKHWYGFVVTLHYNISFTKKDAMRVRFLPTENNICAIGLRMCWFCY